MAILQSLCSVVSSHHMKKSLLKNLSGFYKGSAYLSTKINQNVPVDRIRNIGISAHIDSGKTTLTERILFYTGRIEEMHEVKGKDGVGAVMDSMELERQRGITIQSAATYTMWKDYNINIIDTPGHIDFTVEVERALRVLDGAILVVCSVGGVQCQTFTVNRQMQRYSVPCIAFINKMDRMGAKPLEAFKQLRTKLGHNATLMHLPIGLERNCKGIVDLIEQKAIYYEGPYGEDIRIDEIPSDMVTEAKEKRLEIIENVSNVDEAMGEMFLEDKVPTIPELKAAIRRTSIARTLTPVFLGTALKNKGVQTLLDGVIDYLPCPSDVQNHALRVVNDKEETVPLSSDRDDKSTFVGLAFKLELAKRGLLTYMRVYQGVIKSGEKVYNTRTHKLVKPTKIVRLHSNDMEEIETASAGDIVALLGIDCASGDTFVNKSTSNFSMESMFLPDPVVSMTIKPKVSTDSRKFAKALARFTKEDPSFIVRYDDELKQTLAYGMGELHLEIYSQRMEKEYDIEIELGKPRVSFKECLVAPVEFDYLHKKQTGGSGQYGAVAGTLEPLSHEKHSEIHFRDETFGTDLPKVYVPIIEKAFRKVCEKGHLSGNKICGVLFRLQGGASHIVDSNAKAFTAATEGAMRQAFERGRWEIYEPYMTLEMTVPNENAEIMKAHMRKLNGQLHSLHPQAEWTIIVFEVPLNNMFGFSGDIRALTQGKGEFAMEFSRYLPCSPELETELIDAYQENFKEAARKK